MEPDPEDRFAAPPWLWDAQLREAQLREAQLREAQLREAQLRKAWRRRSLAAGWRIPGDWENEAVDEVLAACRNRAPAHGEAGLAAVGGDALTAACAGLGRSRARAGVGIAETIDDLAALFAVLGGAEGGGPGSPAGIRRCS